jgi:hypothetical protein
MEEFSTQIVILCDSYTGCGCGVCSEDSYTELIVLEDDVHLRTIVEDIGFISEQYLRVWVDHNYPELSGFVLDEDSVFY